MKIIDGELPIVTSFKFLGHLFSSEVHSEVDVENRVIIVRMKWKNLFGVICDRKMQVELKDRVFSVILRPKMAHASE